ncbi:protein-tyrosine phosphatase-like protein [Coniella lustricola]|uniref:Protein-tyrosine phosphatase-like protein n=1 Tax=Coniella lustricola TaxID=2025994 RepID=A0A2T3A780_9PEZI|nr:protein-tyrosine phosphatase-like protein [Coniella lustricola]
MAATTDLRALAETDARHPIAPEHLHRALQTAPFVYVPGTFNTRDIGRLNTLSRPDHGGQKQHGIRPGFLYRTGGLSHLGASPQGQAMLRDTLGIRRIFDLRSRDEHAQSPDPVIDGIEGVWELGTTREKAATVELPLFVDGQGEKGYVAMYLEVLDMYRGIFGEVLKSVRDRPEEAILFHCTAGRDRTGVLAGLLETLAGVDPYLIQTDYLLSRIGYEPARRQLLQFAIRGSGIPVDDTTDLAQFYEVPGFLNMASLRSVCWDAFVDAVADKYGGFEGYVRTALGFSEDDVRLIRKNLVEAP